MQPEEFWALAATQLPAVAGALTALQRQWVVMGVTFKREREDWQRSLAAETKRADDAVAERKAAEVRLDAFRETMKASADVLERSVELTEKLVTIAGRAQDSYEREALNRASRRD